MIKWLHQVATLSEQLLGINARNLDYIYPLNPRKYFPRVDNKLITKSILSQLGIGVPKTLYIIPDRRALAALPQQLDKLNQFVIKPAQGAGGRGILLVKRNQLGEFVTPSSSGESILTLDAIEEHIQYILSGIFALEKISDQAYLEELLIPDERLMLLGPIGIPDIRVILHQGQPAMAMLRLPTPQSRGKANLHQGAIGLGIDLETGVTNHAVYKNKSISKDPISGQSLLGLTIPFWNKIIELSQQSAQPIGLDYLGIDIIIDQHQGPLVVELNARPGLNIQLANLQGLVKPLASGGKDEI